MATGTARDVEDRANCLVEQPLVLRCGLTEPALAVVGDHNAPLIPQARWWATGVPDSAVSVN